MFLAHLLALHTSVNGSGYERLVGEYRGPMTFFDRKEKAKRSFDIDLKIIGDSEGTTWTVKYRFAPPQYQLEFYTGTTAPNATEWTEQTLGGKMSFNLSNWQSFSERTSNWFELERRMDSDGEIHNFRRRFTVQANGDLWSEKWIQFDGKGWEFSHQMELKKIR